MNRRLPDWAFRPAACFSILSVLSVLILAATAPLRAAPSTDAVSVAAAKPATGSADSAEAAAVLRGLAQSLPKFKPEAVNTTPIPGVFEVVRGADILYVTHDGKFAFTGDLIRLSDTENLSENHRVALRRKILNSLSDADMIVFSPANPKYTVTVFTDVDCQYCRLFHSQIAEYNKLGIRVRYASFPRTEPGSPSWLKAEQVWCSQDRKAALTRAKQGEPLETKVCKANPVEKVHQAGVDMGITGTPGVFTSSGTEVGGYVPPDALLKQLAHEAESAAGKS